jgi:hypothetical protein
MTSMTVYDSTGNVAGVQDEPQQMDVQPGTIMDAAIGNACAFARRATAKQK